MGIVWKNEFYYVLFREPLPLRYSWERRFFTGLAAYSLRISP